MVRGESQLMGELAENVCSHTIYGADNLGREIS